MKTYAELERAPYSDILGLLDQKGVTYRVRWEHDEFPDLSYLDQVDENGNLLFPDMPREHVISLTCVLERRCSACDNFDMVGCIGGVDFDDRRECPDLGLMSLDAALQVSNSIQKEIVRQLLWDDWPE